MSSVVDESSMSIRTKRPRPAASRTTVSRFARQSSYESFSPSPVSFTLTLASCPPRSISSSTSTYSSTIASASASELISSPRTSIVAVFPSALRSRTTVIASATVSPAM